MFFDSVVTGNVAVVKEFPASVEPGDYERQLDDKLGEVCRCHSRVVCDVRSTYWISCACLKIISRHTNGCKDRNGVLILCNVNPRIRGILSKTKLDTNGFINIATEETDNPEDNLSRAITIAENASI